MAQLELVTIPKGILGVDAHLYLLVSSLVFTYRRETCALDFAVLCTQPLRKYRKVPTMPYASEWPPSRRSSFCLPGKVKKWPQQQQRTTSSSPLPWTTICLITLPQVRITSLTH